MWNHVCTGSLAKVGAKCRSARQRPLTSVQRPFAELAGVFSDTTDVSGPTANSRASQRDQSTFLVRITEHGFTRIGQREESQD